MKRIAVAVSSLGVALAATALPGGAKAPPLPCTGHTLTGTFRAVPGSPGAGNITYALRLRNRSSSLCFVTGIPRLTLIDSAGRKLPTHATAARPSTLTAAVVPLLPGHMAIATARFSPDIPGPGEPQLKQCERTAHTLGVVPSGGGVVLAPITPPTPVCEHGSMQLSVLHGG